MSLLYRISSPVKLLDLKQFKIIFNYRVEDAKLLKIS
jgi:hypothetical protein